MKNKDIDYSRRIIDFNRQIFRFVNEKLFLFNPYPLIFDHIFYFPEGVRMPDGTIVEDFDYNMSMVGLMPFYNDGPLSMFAGRNYVQAISIFKDGWITYVEMYRRLQFLPVNNVFLYDDVIELGNSHEYRITSRNGIIYCNDEVIFVPDGNPYAESQPLTPVAGLYEDNLSGMVLNLDGCGEDMFGGIYSMDGKSFVRWSGLSFLWHYRLRPGVEKICDKAFWKCHDSGNGDYGVPFHRITLPDSLKYIGKEAFRACSGLRSIAIPDNVLEIDDGAFCGCGSLESITLSRNLSRLGNYAFSDSGLKTITIPKSLEQMGYNVFGDSWNLSSIEVEEGNRMFSSEGGVLFNSDKSVLLKVPRSLYPYPKQETDVEDNPVDDSTWIYSIPETVEVLADRSLLRCRLGMLYIPKSVTSIGEGQFFLSEISEIQVSSENPFYEVRNDMLIDKKRNAVVYWFGKGKDIVIPEGIEIIDSNAFHGEYKEGTIIVPEGVKCIESYAFSLYGDNISLRLPRSLCYLGHLYGDSSSEPTKIIVPKGLAEKFKRLINNSNYYFPIEERNYSEYKFDLPEVPFPENGKVTDKDLESAVADEFGVLYSEDGRKLLRFPDYFSTQSSAYRVKDGTETICEDAFDFCAVDVVHFPASVRFIHKNYLKCRNIVFEGEEIHIGEGTLKMDDGVRIFIPCGTWSGFFNSLEMSRIKNNDEDDDESLHLYELSKPNVMLYLERQKQIFEDILTRRNSIGDYSVANLDGSSSSGFTSFKDNGKLFCFAYGSDLKKYVMYLVALGYDLDNVHKLEDFKIDWIEVKPDTLSSFVGRTLAKDIHFSWYESLSNEDTGEITTVLRGGLLFCAGYVIRESDFDKLLLLEGQKVAIFDQCPSQYSEFIGYCLDADEDYWRNLCPDLYIEDREEAYRQVLEGLFPFKDPEDVTESEKKDLADNLVKLIIAVHEHSDGLSDVQLPLKIDANVDQEVVKTEGLMRNLVSAFYDERINEILSCGTDAEVASLFKDKAEIHAELKAYLESQGITKQIVGMYVDNVFRFMD